GGRTHEQFDAFLDMLHWIDREHAALDRIDNILTQHEMLHIGGRNKHTLVASEAAAHADIEEAFDLVIHAADCLHLTMLVDGACDSKALRDGRLCECRDKRVKLC